MNDRTGMNNLKDTPFDLRRVEYQGRLHGSCVDVIHATQLYKKLEYLEREKLGVISISRLGWIEMPKEKTDD